MKKQIKMNQNQNSQKVAIRKHRTQSSRDQSRREEQKIEFHPEAYQSDSEGQDSKPRESEAQDCDFNSQDVDSPDDNFLNQASSSYAQEMRDSASQASDGTANEADQESDDPNAYEVCFVVEDVEFSTFKQNFLQQSAQFRNIVAQIEEGQQIRILLPLWSMAKAFQIVLDFVNCNDMFWASGDPEREGKDVHLMQNVLWLADFFQLHRLQKQCIDKHIVPGLNRDNIVTFVKDAYAKLLSSQGDQADSQRVASEDIWYNFFNRCLDICAKEIPYLLRFEREQEMLDLPQAVIDEIFERALKMHQRVYFNEIFKFLLRYHKVQSAFDVLDIERRKDVAKYQTLVRNHINAANQENLMMSVRHVEEASKIKPLLCWRLQNLDLCQNFQKDSDAFFHEGIYWKIFLTKTNDRFCQIGLKYAQDFNRESQTIDGQVFFDKYSVLSMLSWTRLEHEPPFGKGMLDWPAAVPLACMPNPNQQVQIESLTLSSSKSQLILRTLPLSALNAANPRDASLSIEVYFQLRPVTSLLLNHITTQFSQLTIWPSWTQQASWPIWPQSSMVLTQTGQSVPMDKLENSVLKLTSDDLSLILAHRKLGVSSEDEVINCLAVWLGGFVKDYQDKILPNIERLSDEQIMGLVSNVNWPYVSFSKLLSLFRSFPRLRSLPLCKNILHNQIMRRVTKKSNQMMAPPRASYSSVMIETIFDYKFYIDKICEFMTATFQLEQSCVIRQRMMEEQMQRLKQENLRLKYELAQKPVPKSKKAMSSKSIPKRNTDSQQKPSEGSELAFQVSNGGTLMSDQFKSAIDTELNAGQSFQTAQQQLSQDMPIVSPVLATVTAGGGSQHQFMNSFEGQASMPDSPDKQMDQLYLNKIEELKELESRMATLQTNNNIQAANQFRSQAEGTLAFDKEWSKWAAGKQVPEQDPKMMIPRKLTSEQISPQKMSRDMMQGIQASNGLMGNQMRASNHFSEQPSPNQKLSFTGINAIHSREKQVQQFKPIQQYQFSEQQQIPHMMRRNDISKQVPMLRTNNNSESPE